MQTVIALIIVAAAAVGLFLVLRRKPVDGDNCRGCPLKEKCTKVNSTSCPDKSESK